QRSTITVTIDGDSAALSAVDGVYELTADGQRVSFGVDEGALPRVMKALAPLGPRGLISTPPSLEELFLRHYGLHEGDTATGAKAAASR
ncbi:MAG: ABC transporter ATP-binding protein, partial [Leifsonia sp.]